MSPRLLVIGLFAMYATTASCAPKTVSKQPPAVAPNPAPPQNGVVALLSVTDSSGKLSVTGVRQLTNQKLQQTFAGPTATHEWSLHSVDGKLLVNGTVEVRNTVEVPPGGPPGAPQQALNATVNVVSFGLHVPWPQNGQYIEIDELDASGKPVPQSKLVWP